MTTSEEKLMEALVLSLVYTAIQMVKQGETNEVDAAIQVVSIMRGICEKLIVKEYRQKFLDVGRQTLKNLMAARTEPSKN